MAYIKWDEQPLGKVPDTHIASDLGVATAIVQAARARRKIPPAPRRTRKAPRMPGAVDWKREKRLGVMPDDELAEDLGVSEATVAKHRCRRGLWKPGRIDWDEQPLGEVPDTHIAEHLSVSRVAVCLARQKRGIPAAPPTTRWSTTRRDVVDEFLRESTSDAGARRRRARRKRV